MSASEAKIMKENSEVHTTNTIDGFHAKQRVILIEWLNSIHPCLALPPQASDEILRAALLDGTVLFLILKRLTPSGENECLSDPSLLLRSERVKKFLIALEEMGISRFEISDLEKGSMKPVIECLLTIREKLLPNAMEEERRKILTQSKLERLLCSPIMSAPSAASVNQVGLKFPEKIQLRQGHFADLQNANITEMMKSSNLDNAPTRSLLSVVNGILDESIQKKNGEIPHRFACLLRKVVMEIERRMSTQADHLRTQNNMFKAREEKYKSRIKVLEALANGNGEETEIVTVQIQQVKMEKNRVEEKREFDDEEIVGKLQKQKDISNKEIAALKQEMEEMKKTYELRCLQLEAEAKESKVALEEIYRDLEHPSRADSMCSIAETALEERIKELGQQQQEESCSKVETETEEKTEETEQDLSSKAKIATTLDRMEELERQLDDSVKARTALEERIKELDYQKADSSSKAKGAAQEERIKELERQLADSRESRNKIKAGLEDKIKDVERQLVDSRNKMKELEGFMESRNRLWLKKENRYKSSVNYQSGVLRALRFSSDFIKQEVLKTKNIYTKEVNQLGVKFKALANAAENYHAVLAENRRLFNEIQDLKGNIRVYCRIRPFLPGQNGKQTIVEHIGDDGELVVGNPSKPGKENHRAFKFNKVFGPSVSQVEVYTNIQPYVRSVVDGYNVCIFAYGQTGSGKTYTMSGPNDATEATWGVNYRALNDLFQISGKRSSTIEYEVMVQMIEIYNEQVRDLLSAGGPQKKLGIMASSQGSGLTVPDACIHNVRKTSDVLDLMDIGFKNRSVSATAMNERSSRSHSVITIHVRGRELKTGTTLKGSLHLVDLAGSERVDRSEVAGDRLKEAQHINKSLSALGDVVFALSQKNAHVPYRNSKLTQLLQSSLGGQAKTLMFVQLNPDVSSYSESLSTLKFAERVSGVELGAAKSSKEGNHVRELMDQVTSLKDTISIREEEIAKLQVLNEVKNAYPGIERCGSGSSRYASPSPSPFARDITHSMSMSLGEQDFEERTSDASDMSHFLEAETDSYPLSPPQGIPLSNNLERSKSLTKVVRPSIKSVHTTTSTIATASTDSPRKPPSFNRSSSSITPKAPSSKRWQ